MAEKIDIDLGGETISVPAWASEETLQMVLNELKGKGGNLAESLKKSSAALGGTTARPGTFTGSIKSASVGTDKLKVSVTKTEKAFEGMKGMLAGGAGLIGAIANTKGKFADLNPVTDIIVDTFTSLASAMPFVGNVIRGLGEVGKSLIRLNNEILDNTVQGFYDLSGAGFGLQNDLLQLQQSALEGRITLAQLAEATMSAQTGVLNLGASFDEGVKKFAAVQARLANEDGEFAMSMKALGFGATDTAQLLAEFVENQRMSIRMRTMDEKELAKRTFDYAKNLRVVSEFTGQEADQLRAEQQRIAADGAFQSKLQQMRMNNQSAEAEAIQTFIANLPTDQAKTAAKEIVAFGGSVTEQSALFNMIAPNFNAAINDMMSQVVESGGTIDISSMPAYADAVQAIADISTDANNLQIGTYNMLEGSGNSLSSLIADVLTSSAELNAILGKEGAQKYFNDLNEDVQDAVDPSRLPKFNQELLTAITLLQTLGPEMQATILANMDEVVRFQLKGVSGLTKVIDDVMALMDPETRGEKIKELSVIATDMAVKAKNVIIEATEKGATNLQDIVFSPIIGAGQGEAGMDVGLLDYLFNIDDSKGMTTYWTDFLKTMGLMDESYTVKKASGGHVGGGLYTVGERGPEILRMDPGSTGHVYPNAVARSMGTPRYAGGPTIGAMDFGSMAGPTVETQESSALPSMQKGGYTGTSNFANELTNGLRPIANVEMEMKAMRRDIKNLMTKVLTANGHF